MSLYQAVEKKRLLCRLNFILPTAWIFPKLEVMKKVFVIDSSIDKVLVNSGIDKAKFDFKGVFEILSLWNCCHLLPRKAKQKTNQKKNL